MRNGLIVAAFMVAGVASAALPDGFSVDGRAPKTAWAELGHRTETCPGDPKAARRFDRAETRWEVGPREELGGGLWLERRVCDRGTYRRFVYTITADQPTQIGQITFFADEPGTRNGTADGAVLVRADGASFLAVEHPMTKLTAKEGRFTATLPCGVTLAPGERLIFAAVEGKVRPGQLRRDFQAYLEEVRAHPYRVLPHYNSWYHLGIDGHTNPDPLKRMTAARCLAAMEAVAAPLAKRGVTLDSYLWDDGWDDRDSLWAYHAGFPKGFSPLADFAHAHGGSIGAWLSPWGGYNASKTARVAHAKAIGLPTNAGGLSLAQPRYREAFTARCLQMVADYDMNLFKFDGIGGGVWALGTDAATAPDLRGLFAHIEALRRAKPDLFVNCTVGTWPSPFWTLWADSIWRGGGDWGQAGPGPQRERWITYRDNVVHDRLARDNPLYPLNSIMLHGVIVAKQFGMAVGPDPAATRAFANEAWMGVACGTGLQEFYLTPEIMPEAWWDILAEAIRWLRANATVLRDAHWHGGSPAQGQPYGYAAWTPEKAVLIVRNPSDKPQAWSPDFPAALELPSGAPTPKPVAIPYSSHGRALPLPGTLTLEPFEVLLIELRP